MLASREKWAPDPEQEQGTFSFACMLKELASLGVTGGKLLKPFLLQKTLVRAVLGGQLGAEGCREQMSSLTCCCMSSRATLLSSTNHC